MYFPSKKDLWLYPIYWVTILACLSPLFAGEEYELLFFTIPLAILFVWGWYSTGYIVESDLLTIQSGPMKKRIPIKEIKKISKTKNPLSSPALSMDRLEIIYGEDYSMALVSPKNKQAFTSMLKNMNPQIEVDNNIL